MKLEEFTQLKGGVYIVHLKLMWNMLPEFLRNKMTQDANWLFGQISGCAMADTNMHIDSNAGNMTVNFQGIGVCLYGEQASKKTGANGIVRAVRDTGGKES